MGLRSEVNEHVPPAAPGEFAIPHVGPLAVWPPVVLAPMAGVTNAPFRSLCREFGAGLYVSEMITSLIDKSPERSAGRLPTPSRMLVTFHFA